MKLKLITLILISSLGVSCSSKKNEINKVGNIDLTNIDETAIEPVETNEIVSLETSGLLKEDNLEVTASSLFDDTEKYEVETPVISDEVSDDMAEFEENDSDHVSRELASDDGGEEVTSTLPPDELDQNMPETVEYIVQKNETLMLIAYKLYGDYSKWKTIADVNGSLLSTKKLTAGQKF